MDKIKMMKLIFCAFLVSLGSAEPQTASAEPAGTPVPSPNSQPTPLSLATPAPSAVTVKPAVTPVVSPAATSANSPTVTPAPSPSLTPSATPSANPSETPSAKVIENSPEVKAVPSSKAVTEKMSREDAIRFYRQRQRITPDAAKVYDGYLGVELGLAQVSGTYYNLDSGFAYGVTAGIDTPIIGVGFTARHQANGIYRANSKEKITQLLMELNFFSYLLLNGGFQIGDIITKLEDKTSNSLGLGMHAGFDLHFTKELTAGLGAYWTFVLQPNDKHSLFNIMIPVKYWF